MELAQPIENDDSRCEICDKLFKNNKNKKPHIRSVHGEEMNFTCNVCTKKFGKKNQLSLHLKNYH